MPSQFPYFIQERVIYSSDLHLSRQQRSSLALLNNLHLYEVHNKQVLNFINLQDTILTKVQNRLESIVPEINGIATQTSDILGSSVPCPNYPVAGIILGKYIYQNSDDKNVYILLKCWDLLIVIKRDSEGFTLQAEYKEVITFRMCKTSNYQDELAIIFNNGGPEVVTNFQKNDIPSSSLPNANASKKILNRIKMKQSELLVHKTITKKEFAKLKSIDLFGCNFLRTPRLEEMQILSKCGNAWVKVASNDAIMIGVPLVNNCSTRLTVLRNLRAVLQSGEDLDYKFSLYHLNEKLSDIEKVQSFYQNQHGDDHDDCSWSQCTDFSLRPEAFCVLVLRLQIHELLKLSVMKLPLFAFYDIVMSERIFSQKCFLTALSFREVFTNELYRVNFDEKHLHRDLLAVIATSYKSDGQIEYKANGVAFEKYLCSQMDFFSISHSQSCSETMNVDEQDKDENFEVKSLFFYNKNPNSLWHGTLLAITNTNDSCSDIKLYTKTQEKSKVFFSLLHTELKIKCDIKDVRRGERNSSSQLIKFEGALRDECYSYLEMCSSKAMEKDNRNINRKQSLQNQLYLSELYTDRIFEDLEL